ncbi:hypothetical protein FQN54_002019 [Arachnomyces sp. PD_36]|nr:hypothetical protein FQN54_002019 [Arachnomyces sp. PD_36]
MWLYRGAQSAVFYYAACTPCVAGLDRKKRKREASRAMRQKEKEREDIVTRQPTAFHQPSPFNTNIYWQEEITLGPGPPARRGGIRNGSRSGSRRNVASPSSPPTLSSQSTREVDEPSSHIPETVPEEGKKRLSGDRWNWIRYQREDEVLWGGEVKGSSVGLSGRGRADTASSKKYYVAKNPAVNDLHPPVVSGPSSIAETRWMLQPPPNAKIMAGKVRCGGPLARTREDSVGRRAGGEMLYGIPLEDCEEEEMEERAEERDSFGRRSGRKGNAQGFDNASHSPVSKKSSQKRSRIPSPINISKDHTSQPETSVESEDLRLPTRPALATIASSSVTVPTLHQKSHQPHRASSSINSLSSCPSPVSTAGGTSHTSTTPWQWQFNWPEETDFRPSTNDSGKAFHVPVSTSLWAINAKHRDPHDLYLDADHCLPDSEHMETVRPCRWSMDI